MSDSGFREIQLSGKHVVFLFMAGVVVAVAIFLLGVSVGRGVTKPEAAAQATPASVDTMAGGGQPVELPATTTPQQGELRYPDTLRGVGAAQATSSPAAPVKPSATPTPGAKPSATPGAATKPGAAAKSDAVWYVPVNSFSSRANATKQVDELKSKGITARINTRSGSGAPYQVRVGPLDKAAADAMVARLRKEGYKPSQPIR